MYEEVSFTDKSSGALDCNSISPEEIRENVARKLYEDSNWGRLGTGGAPTRDTDRGAKAAGENGCAGNKTAAAAKVDRTAVDLSVELLHAAMDQFGTNEDAIYAALEGRSQAERESIARVYEEKYGSKLEDDIKSEMSGEELERALAALNGKNGIVSKSLDRSCSSAQDEAAIDEKLPHLRLGKAGQGDSARQAGTGLSEAASDSASTRKLPHMVAGGGADDEPAKQAGKDSSASAGAYTVEDKLRNMSSGTVGHVWTARQADGHISGPPDHDATKEKLSRVVTGELGREAEACPANESRYEKALADHAARQRVAEQLRKNMHAGSFGSYECRQAVINSFRSMDGRTTELDMLVKINRWLAADGAEYRVRFGHSQIKDAGACRLEIVDPYGHVTDRLDFVVPPPATPVDNVRPLYNPRPDYNSIRRGPRW
ncbi:MAG TPA: annexin [Candidatus Obscuribacterales bacterium]